MFLDLPLELCIMVLERLSDADKIQVVAALRLTCRMFCHLVNRIESLPHHVHFSDHSEDDPEQQFRLRNRALKIANLTPLEPAWNRPMLIDSMCRSKRPLREQFSRQFQRQNLGFTALYHAPGCLALNEGIFQTESPLFNSDYRRAEIDFSADMFDNARPICVDLTGLGAQLKTIRVVKEYEELFGHDCGRDIGIWARAVHHLQLSPSLSLTLQSGLRKNCASAYTTLLILLSAVETLELAHESLLYGALQIVIEEEYRSVCWSTHLDPAAQAWLMPCNLLHGITKLTMGNDQGFVSLHATFTMLKLPNVLDVTIIGLTEPDTEGPLTENYRFLDQDPFVRRSTCRMITLTDCDAGYLATALILRHCAHPYSLRATYACDPDLRGHHHSFWQHGKSLNVLELCPTDLHTPWDSLPFFSMPRLKTLYLPVNYCSPDWDWHPDDIAPSVEHLYLLLCCPAKILLPGPDGWDTIPESSTYQEFLEDLGFTLPTTYTIHLVDPKV